MEGRRERGKMRVGRGKVWGWREVGGEEGRQAREDEDGWSVEGKCGDERKAGNGGEFGKRGLGEK